MQSKNSYILSSTTSKVKSPQQNMENSEIKYTSESIKMSNSHINFDSSSNTNNNIIRYTVSSHHDITTLPTIAKPRPQWYGIQLAKQQSWQEQRVFANHQCVRFLSPRSTADNSTTGNSDDEDDQEETTTNSKPSWRFSRLANQFLKLEQECFANGLAKIRVNVQESEEMGDARSEWRFEVLARHWERLEQRAFAGSFGRR